MWVTYLKTSKSPKDAQLCRHTVRNISQTIISLAFSHWCVLIHFRGHIPGNIDNEHNSHDLESGFYSFVGSLVIRKTKKLIPVRKLLKDKVAKDCEWWETGGHLLNSSQGLPVLGILRHLFVALNLLPCIFSLVNGFGDIVWIIWWLCDQIFPTPGILMFICYLYLY